MAQDPDSVSSAMETVAVPHASLAVSVAAAGMLLHSTVALLGNVPLKVGAVVSSMVNVACVVAVLPHASEDVKVTSTEPVAPHSSLRDTWPSPVP